MTLELVQWLVERYELDPRDAKDAASIELCALLLNEAVLETRKEKPEWAKVSHRIKKVHTAISIRVAEKGGAYTSVTYSDLFAVVLGGSVGG